MGKCACSCRCVGFVGAWQHPDGLPPLLAATVGALLTTCVTFTSCFRWIFLGGPHIEKLRRRDWIALALFPGRSFLTWQAAYYAGCCERTHSLAKRAT